jgi:hypothetical protein
VFNLECDDVGTRTDIANIAEKGRERPVSTK